MLGPCGAILLKSLWGRGWRTSIDASEVGAYEYEVNDVYGSLTDLAADQATYLNRAAVRGVSFAARMLKDAAALPGADRLIATVGMSVDEKDEDFSCRVSLLDSLAVEAITQHGSKIWSGIRARR